MICIYHFVALLHNEGELFTGPPFLREVFNIPIYSATYWDNWPIERGKREISLSAVVASDKPEKTRSRINGDSGMEPKENSAESPLMKSPVLPLLKFDAIRSLLLRREPFKEGVKVQMRPGSPFMCRVNPLGGWWDGPPVGHVLVLSLRSSPMRAVSAMRRRKGERGDGKKPPLEIS